MPGYGCWRSLEVAYRNETDLEMNRFSVELLAGEDPGVWAWESPRGPKLRPNQPWKAFRTMLYIEVVRTLNCRITSNGHPLTKQEVYWMKSHLRIGSGIDL